MSTAARLLASSGLVKNKSLRKLWFNPTTCGITSTGWEGFKNMLCDTLSNSSRNNIYLTMNTMSYFV
jgi:hypothetical protein